MIDHEAIRKALEKLPAECRKPWRQLDGLPYLHATEDENAKPWGTPVVGRFDYLETMTYIAACNPEAITALIADRDRLAAEVESRQWQPIETAPKDGTRFLAFCDGKINFFHWQDFRDGGNSPIGWRDSFINVYREGTGPKHWMPLPASPEEGTS